MTGSRPGTRTFGARALGARWFGSGPPGLRLRIAAVITAIVLVAVLSLSFAVHLLVVRARVGEARTGADERLQAAVSIYRSTGILTFDARFDDPEVPADLRAALTSEGVRATDVRGVGNRELWAATRYQGRILSIHSSFVPEDATVRSLDRALLVSGVITVVVASALGALSANRLSHRLRLAARTARTVTAGEAPGSLRQAVGPGRDEVGNLADAVDAMAARLAERLTAEQRFTADVAHDLRTPLAGLVAASSLLDDSRPAAMVRDRTRALTALVEDLLEIARLDAGVETAELEHVRVADVVARTVARGETSAEFPAGAVSVTSRGPSTTVLTDARRLERVLSNLIRNALSHGRPPVTVSSDRRRIVVADAGDGFPAELLAAGPQRFRTPDQHRGQGHGLGLTIALGQTVVLGGTLSFANGPDGGAVVTLELPGDPHPSEPTEGTEPPGRPGRQPRPSGRGRRVPTGPGSAAREAPVPEPSAARDRADTAPTPDVAP